MYLVRGSRSRVRVRVRVRSRGQYGGVEGCSLGAVDNEGMQCV